MDCSFLRDRVTGMVWWVDRMIRWDFVQGMVGKK